MKVELSSTRLYSIPQNRNINNKASGIQKGYGYNNSERLGPVVRLSFKGNYSKNASQFISIAAEDKGLGVKEYNKGGLAVVVQEANNSWNKSLGADARVILPYHAPSNPNGYVKVVTKLTPEEKKMDVLNIPEERIIAKPTDYRLKDNEVFVLQSAPDENGISKCLPLERTKVSGTVRALKSNSLEFEDVGYHLFKLNQPNAASDAVVKYFMHTKNLAKAASAYGYSMEDTNVNAYARCLDADMLYSINNRAITAALPQMNTKEFGFFNPANIWLHDRQAFTALIDMADRSNGGEKYYNGLRMHSTFHNPGRAYQGFYDDPLKFFRIVATERSLDELRNHPEYEKLKEIDLRRANNTITNDDLIDVKRILASVINPFIDSEGTYNITKIALVGSDVNKYNMTCGTVSINYGKESRDFNTLDIARGLTDDFARTRTINITNGSSPASLKLGDPTAGFGYGGNGLSDNKSTFATFNYDKETGKLVSSTQEVVDAKKANTKWLLDIIGSADTSKDANALNKIFFNAKQMQDGPTILGQLSSYQEGDKLIMGWGRPDAQKGMPTTVEAFLKFLKDPSISEEVKLKTKLIAGAGVWNAGDRDWIKIQDLMREIQTLDNGKYFNNAMYVNGFFPNRLASCATYSIFTSVFEPCGITPLESYAAGTPVISVNTGGARDIVKSLDEGVDAISDQTGFLSKQPYLLNPESFTYSTEEAARMKANKDVSWSIVDDKRRNKSSDEIAGCIKRAIGLDNESYNKMVANTLAQKISWEENAGYNGGTKSANARYMGEVFEVTLNDKSRLTGTYTRTRYMNPLKRICQLFTGVASENTTGEVSASLKATKLGKLITVGVLGVIAVGTGIALYCSNQKAKLVGRQILPRNSKGTNKIA